MFWMSALHISDLVGVYNPLSKGSEYVVTFIVDITDREIRTIDGAFMRRTGLSAGPNSRSCLIEYKDCPAYIRKAYERVVRWRVLSEAVAGMIMEEDSKGMMMSKVASWLNKEYPDV